MVQLTTSTPVQPGETGLLFTAAEVEAHREELERLLEIRDRDLPRLRRHVRGFVASDVAEEIVQIQEDLAVVEQRISWLEETLREARIVTDVEDGVVSVGRLVEVEYQGSGRVAAYHVTGSALSAGPGSLSAGSPVGRALMGRVAGDVVAADLPTGRVEHLRILAVRPSEVTSWR